MSRFRSHPALLADAGALFAGLALPFAFAPYGLYPLAFAALAVLFATWRRATPGRAFWRGWLFGLGQFGFGVYWLHISIHLFGGINLAGALAITYLLVAYLALYPAAVGYLSRLKRVRSEPFWLLFAVPALWVLAEWIRSWLFTGFPWLNLGYSQIDGPLAGLAPIAGVYAVSWGTALAAALLLVVCTANWHGRLAALLALVAMAAGTHLARDIEWSQAHGTPLKVALIQGAVPQAIKWNPEQLEHTIQLYRDLTEPHWDADIIVWPETAIPAFYHQIAPVTEFLRERAIENRAYLLMGTVVSDPDTERYYNSIVALGERAARYDKRHLVPFGEYLPLRFLLDGFLDFLAIPMSDFSPGDPDKPLLDLGKLRIGTSICYEDAFGEEVIQALPAADFLVNVSNDAWFGDSIAPHQHLQIARMRALETGRYLLRATNTGVSAIIGPDGRIMARSPQFTPHVLIGEITRNHGMSFYARFGNMPVLIAMLLCLAGSIRLKTTTS